jgi:hypothetical protein
MTQIWLQMGCKARLDDAPSLTFLKSVDPHVRYFAFKISHIGGNRGARTLPHFFSDFDHFLKKIEK